MAPPTETINQSSSSEQQDNTTDQIRSFLQRMFSDMSVMSAGKQAAIGAGTGFLAGKLFQSIGKASAIFVGGSVIALQLAHHKGYVKLNWGQLEKDAKLLGEKLEQKARGSFQSYGESVEEFCRQNVFLAGGFAGGFFIGLGS